MSKNTSELDMVREYLDAVGATWTRRIDRADGTTEVDTFHNSTIAAGLNVLAALGVGRTDAGSAFRYLAVGTVTDQHSLGSANFGEVSRKLASTVTSSREVMILTATWAGNADGVSGVALATGAMCNHADSAQGEILSLVSSVDATLGDSDFLTLTAEFQVGSHNL